MDEEYEKELEITSENRKKFIEDFIKVAFRILKKDAQLKLLSIKAPKVKETEFLQGVLNIKTMVDIFEQSFPSDPITGTCLVTKDMYNCAIQKALSEWKNRIYSKLSDERITAMFYDKKTEKIYWSFPEREVPDEKQILKRRDK
jgi:Mg/Co/Ni transporter MgtE